MLKQHVKTQFNQRCSHSKVAVLYLNVPVLHLISNGRGREKLSEWMDCKLSDSGSDRVIISWQNKQQCQLMGQELQQLCYMTNTYDLLYPQYGFVHPSSLISFPWLMWHVLVLTVLLLADLAYPQARKAMYCVWTVPGLVCTALLCLSYSKVVDFFFFHSICLLLKY